VERKLMSEQVAVKREPKPGEPYCSNCGYVLTGATETTVCPECGKPLVEVLVRGRVAWATKGKRFRTEATLWGLPIIDVAMGPDENGRRGRAKGIIAIGDIATGFIAIGNAWATGVVAIGGGGGWGIATIGGGCGIGVISAIGGGAVGGFAIGGMAVGGIAVGGGAAGFVAQGGAAAGYYARGGGVVGVHVVGGTRADTKALEVFAAMEGVIGAPGSQIGMLRPVMTAAAPVVALGAVGLVLAMWGHRRGVRG
jgi:hypothetical protein